MVLTNHEKKVIVDHLVQALQPEFIYLFGSFARGEGRDDSDIDLAVYTPAVIDPYTLFQHSGALGRLLKRDVQIVHLLEINTVFAARIVATREELYCHNQHLMNVFNMNAFKEYAVLNERREIVMETIAKDGSVYGYKQRV